MTQAPPVDRARVVGAATLLFGARRSNSKLPSLPADARPASAAEAFAIQEEVTRLEGLPIGGWKVGLDPGVRFSFAPIYVPAVRESPAIIRSAGVSSLIIEAEVAFHLAADLPVRDVPYTAAEVAAAVAGACAAIEIGDPRLLDFMPAPLEHKIADNMGNGAIVHGTGTVCWQALDRARLPVRVEVDGETVAQAVGGNSAGDPLAALVGLANAPLKKDALRAGQIVITGTCTGMHPGRPGTRIRAVFDGLGEARAELA